MGMDRNTVIGFVLLAGLLFVYLFISTKNSQDLQKKQQLYDDSVARVQVMARKNSAAHTAQTVDTSGLASAVGFQRASYGTETLVTLENDVMRVIFTNKGGQPK